MKIFLIQFNKLWVILGVLMLAGCGTSGSPDSPASGTAMLKAAVFQEHWAGGGGTLMIRSIDGEMVWRNQMEIGPGAHEVQDLVLAVEVIVPLALAQPIDLKIGEQFLAQQE